MKTLQSLNQIHQVIEKCRSCPQVCGTPVHGPAIFSKIFLVGQAPGVYEAERGRPFAHTAGKTLFSWFEENCGVDEDQLRQQIYIASVARCFPGKSASGKGDREPSAQEIQNCRKHLEREVDILKPKIILAVGKVAIAEVLGPELFPKSSTLASVVGRKIEARFHGKPVLVYCLPHPSGISVWTRVEPGRTLLRKALSLIAQDPTWQKIFQ